MAHHHRRVHRCQACPRRHRSLHPCSSHMELGCRHRRACQIPRRCNRARQCMPRTCRLISRRSQCRHQRPPTHRYQRRRLLLLPPLRHPCLRTGRRRTGSEALLVAAVHGQSLLVAWTPLLLHTEPSLRRSNPRRIRHSCPRGLRTCRRRCSAP